jgi:hypothetical protein
MEDNMNNLYTVESQKTYKGKTAGGWLKTATIAECEAGIVYVWINGYQAVLADDGDLVLSDYSGIVASIVPSSRALRKMRKLEKLADKKNAEKYND